jgi:hypothetical protein
MVAATSPAASAAPAAAPDGVGPDRSPVSPGAGHGPVVLARQLAFGAATSYTAVSPGAQPVRFTAPGQHTARPVTLAAGTVHTIVVLDDSSGLKVDAVTDAAGSKIMPKGAVSAGFGGIAPPASANPAPWLVMIAAGALLAAAGLVRLRRPFTDRDAASW